MTRHTDNDVLIKVKQLSRYYPVQQGMKAAVNHISFEVRRGQVLGFLGPNGAGKSTTMQMLSGNLAPSSGEIHIGDYDLLEDPAQAKSLIGYLPDTPPLYKEFTVNEYLLFCAGLNRINKADQPSALAIVKQRCGLEEVGNRVIGNLSKGYQQRVGIAQAIIHNPEIVILDEPTVGLDPHQMREIRQLIRELGKTHSVIISSHILTEIQAICSHVQIIHKGALVMSDTIEGLAQQMQTTLLRIGLMQAPQTEKLMSIDGIAQVNPLGDGYWQLQLSQPTSSNSIQLSAQERNGEVQLISQQVIEICQQQQWGLFEITPEHLSLEDVFMQLTTDDTPPQHEANGSKPEVTA